METFTFIKITNPPAYEEVFIRSSTIDEVITKLSATLGATISFDAVTANTININKEWNRRKTVLWKQYMKLNLIISQGPYMLFIS